MHYTCAYSVRPKAKTYRKSAAGNQHRDAVMRYSIVTTCVLTLSVAYVGAVPQPSGKRDVLLWQVQLTPDQCSGGQVPCLNIYAVNQTQGDLLWYAYTTGSSAVKAMSVVSDGLLQTCMQAASHHHRQRVRPPCQCLRDDTQCITLHGVDQGCTLSMQQQGMCAGSSRLTIGSGTG